MSTTRRIKKRLFNKVHAQALGEVALWESKLQAHFHLTVAKLVHEGQVRKRMAQLMAYRAIVKGLQGKDTREVMEEIAAEHPTVRTQGHELKAQPGDELAILSGKDCDGKD